MSKKLVEHLRYEAFIRQRDPLGGLLDWAADELVEMQDRLKKKRKKPLLSDDERDAIIVAAVQSEKMAHRARKIPGPTAGLILQHASVLRGIAKRLA